MLPCLVPQWPQIIQIRISFRSRSDLVLILFWILTMPWIFVSYLVLQACISFCSVSDRSGASLFLPCSHKHAVAHIGGRMGGYRTAMLASIPYLSQLYYYRSRFQSHRHIAEVRSSMASLCLSNQISTCSIFALHHSILQLVSALLSMALIYGEATSFLTRDSSYWMQLLFLQLEAYCLQWSFFTYN